MSNIELLRVVAVFLPRRTAYSLVGALPILWESVAPVVHPENPRILEILIQTITKIPKRVKTRAEYGVNESSKGNFNHVQEI